MNHRLLILILIIMPAWLIGQNTESDKANRKQYIKEIKIERSHKNNEFTDTAQSPLSYEQIANFSGLNYFRPDTKYKVIATFHKVEIPVTFKMKTSTNRQPEYRTFGTISFNLMDTTVTLQVYQNVELIKKTGYADYLFVPFTDETSADESYGGGRYLDLRIPQSNNIEIDFNKAYNPYCAYNHRYSCPIPPAENHIPIKIEAGERKYQ
ncbi:MAG: DUF1684 domain-containing protein [Bacteroidales bacterium]